VTRNGIWVWQNANSLDHSIRDFVAYANAVGIDHGAYRNRFTYDGIVLAGNSVAGLELHTLVATKPLAEWSNWRIGGSAISVSVLSSSASAPRNYPVRFVGCDFTGKIMRNDNRRGEVRIIVPKGGC
jgi:hypothetical protein